ETVDRIKATYGLKPFDPSKLPGSGPPENKPVVLVHGLDDPGIVWMTLAPVLSDDGFSVLILTYPNDQPIAESARFFLKSLESMPPGERISIVAHSMGGLVAREMLTNPELDYGAKADSGALPRVDRLIMVGTPNHGSELARFRIVMEIRDQLVSLSTGDYHWLRGVVDGVGEAGIDLTPGSEFLTRLNRRPHPPNVDMMVIAGVLSQEQKDEIDALATDLKDRVPDEGRGAGDTMEDMLLSMTRQIGDGLVPLTSARLPGIEFNIVSGTHLSMIRNLTATSQRIPPAIPIIVEALGR
ncbi:MAG: hypothetical protein PVH30_06480, partial [Desulfobacterales bacterium]